MSKPKLYGIAGSRAFRSLWAAEEIGLEYEQVPTSFRGDAQQPEYLQVNPNGRIPALEDGELRLFESMAINLYLARQYAPHLYSTDPAAEAQIDQWSLWAISEIEPQQMAIVIQRFFTPEEKRDADVQARAEQALQRPLKVLDAHLSERPYLLGEQFSIADLNLAGVMDLMKMVELDISHMTHVQRWLDACYARPSYLAAKGLK